MTQDEARRLIIEGINYAAYKETDSSLHDSDKNRLFGSEHYRSGREVVKPSAWAEGNFEDVTEKMGLPRTPLRDSVAAWVDIDGGISTLFVYASKGTRELPNSRVYVDGGLEALSKGGSFVGQHVCVPLEGAAVHINAFNFPVWGMLEKLAPTLLAGMPAIVKPAS